MMSSNLDNPLSSLDYITCFQIAMQLTCYFSWQAEKITKKKKNQNKREIAIRCPELSFFVLFSIFTFISFHL